MDRDLYCFITYAIITFKMCHILPNMFYVLGFHFSLVHLARTRKLGKKFFEVKVIGKISEKNFNCLSLLNKIHPIDLFWRECLLF